MALRTITVGWMAAATVVNKNILQE